MKCEKCGTSLKIEYNVCPSCGTPNPFAVGHREDMEKYSKAFEETREAVIEKTGFQFGIMIKIIACLVLVVLSGVAIYVSANVHEISVSRQVNRVKNNINAYRAEAESFEKNRDYIGFDQWYGTNVINKVDELAEYRVVDDACEYYSRIFETVIANTDLEKNETSSWSFSDDCQNIARDLVLLREVVEKNNDNAHFQLMQDAYSEAKVLVKSLFRLSDEDYEKIDVENDAQIAVILLESWPYEQ